MSIGKSTMTNETRIELADKIIQKLSNAGTINDVEFRINRMNDLVNSCLNESRCILLEKYNAIDKYNASRHTFHSRVIYWANLFGIR